MDLMFWFNKSEMINVTDLKKQGFVSLIYFKWHFQKLQVS